MANRYQPDWRAGEEEGEGPTEPRLADLPKPVPEKPWWGLSPSPPLAGRVGERSLACTATSGSCQQSEERPPRCHPARRHHRQFLSSILPLLRPPPHAHFLFRYITLHRRPFISLVSLLLPLLLLSQRFPLRHGSSFELQLCTCCGSWGLSLRKQLAERASLRPGAVPGAASRGGSSPGPGAAEKWCCGVQASMEREVW